MACYVDIRGIHEYAAKRPPSTPEPDGARYGEFPVELVAVVLAIAMTAFFYYTTMNCGDLLA